MPTFNIDLPQITSDPRTTGHYLYRLAEQLNTALNSLDDENMAESYRKAVTDVITVSDKAKTLAELLDNGELAKTKSVRDMYKMLRDSIFESAENVTASFNSLIEQTRNEIRTFVEANYIAADPNMTLDEKISSLISQTAEEIRLEFATLSTINVDAVNDLLVNFGMYFRFTDKGLEIGQIGDGSSPIVSRLTNNRWEFVLAGTDVVILYIDGETNKAHMEIAEADTVSIGNDNDGYLDFDMESTGLYVKWRS